VPTPKKKGPDVNPLVAALNPDPAQPPRRTYKLWGLPGPSPSSAQTRLWLDGELTSYVDVPNDSIAYSKTLDDDAGTILWVDADAPVTFGSVAERTPQADFLSGSITASHLAAAAAGGVAPTPAVAPLPSLVPCAGPTHPICATVQTECLPHTVVACPSVAILCPTHVVGCPSVPVGACPPPHTVVACPSVQVVCPTHLLGCPSVQVVCPTHFAGCPSVPAIACPSHQVPCASVHAPPVCGIPTHVNCPSVTSPCPSHLQALCNSIQLPCTGV
jgi:hypothetical protein